MKNIQSYRDLIVWQKAMDLVVLIYKITESFPSTEKYGLTSQMRRSAISIPSNIAEGRRLGSRKNYAQFLKIAYGSVAELETQIEICERLLLKKPSDLQSSQLLLNEITKILSKMISTLSKS